MVRIVPKTSLVLLAILKRLVYKEFTSDSLKSIATITEQEKTGELTVKDISDDLVIYRDIDQIVERIPQYVDWKCPDRDSAKPLETSRI